MPRVTPEKVATVVASATFYLITCATGWWFLRSTENHPPLEPDAFARSSQLTKGKETPALYIHSSGSNMTARQELLINK